MLYLQFQDQASCLSEFTARQVRDLTGLICCSVRESLPGLLSAPVPHRKLEVRGRNWNAAIFRETSLPL